MATDKLRAHLACLIQQLRETGLCLLDQMEAEGEIGHEDRRTFQYIFCRGMGYAHFILDQPDKAIASERTSSKDRQVTSTIESGVRMVAEDWLEHCAGKKWRVDDVLSCAPQNVDTIRNFLHRLRDALTAKPSEVRKLLDDRVSTRGATTGREPSDAGRSEAEGGG